MLLLRVGSTYSFDLLVYVQLLQVESPFRPVLAFSEAINAYEAEHLQAVAADDENFAANMKSTEHNVGDMYEMFASWCADVAGIVEDTIPLYVTMV